MSSQSRALAILIIIFRVIIGAVFVWASFDKIAHVTDFGRSIHNYRMVPIAVENVMAIALPWIELFAGLFLIIGYKVRGSSFVISVLLLVFIIAVSAALARGLDISCGCFNTKGGSKVGLDLLIRDIIFLIMAGTVLLFSRETEKGSIGFV